MLGTGLVVVHNTLVGGQDKDTELSGGKHGGGKVLEVLELEVETGGDNTALVQTTVKVDNDLAIASVVDDLELGNVTVSLHHLEELDEHLGDGAEDNLNYKYNRLVDPLLWDSKMVRLKALPKQPKRVTI